MDQYTQMLDDEAATLSPDDDYYEEKLLEVARSFRTFSEALTQFVCDNGYEGADDDTDGKLAFLKNKFKSAKVPVPLFRQVPALTARYLSYRHTPFFGDFLCQSLSGTIYLLAGGLRINFQ